MKTRIIKHTLLGEEWYTVEYKQFLFWQTWKDLYDCDVRYWDLNEAKRTARNLTSKEIKEVINEDD